MKSALKNYLCIKLYVKFLLQTEYCIYVAIYQYFSMFYYPLYLYLNLTLLY